MRHFSLAVAAALVALLGQGCALEQPSAKADVLSREPSTTNAALEKTFVPKSQQLVVITPQLRELILEQYTKYKRVLATTAIDCEMVGDLCPIVIQIVQVSDANGTYCVGLLPEKVTFRGTRPNNSPKRIVWRLLVDPPVPNADFFFHDENDHGIIWLSNIGSPRQMHTGRLGDGSVGSPDRMRYVVRNRHSDTGEAVYVPIVMQKDTTNGKISLCGTPDPTIRNDN